VGLYFLQVPNRDIDRRSQINYQLGLTLGSTIAKRDDFSSQRDTPESSGKDAGVRLINRYQQHPL
jgi:hypothetical protein